MLTTICETCGNEVYIRNGEYYDKSGVTLDKPFVEYIPHTHKSKSQVDKINVGITKSVG